MSSETLGSIDFTEEIKSFAKDNKAPNILVTGRMAGGKSTLIDAVFGKKILEEPHISFGGVTKTFVRHGAGDNAPVTLFDSAGFETAKGKQFVEDTINFLTDQQKKGPGDQIHLVWYVVNTSYARFEEFERDLIQRLNKMRIPVIVVLSQDDRASASEREGMSKLLTEATKELALTFDIIKVAAAPLVINGTPVCQPYGLQELVEKTVDRLPEMYRLAFIRTQIVSIQTVRKTAYTYTATAAGVCFATGFVPIPLTTIFSTLFAQKQLAVKLASLYGFQHLPKVLEALNEVTKTKEARTVFIISTLSDLLPFEPLTSTLAGGGAASYLMIIGLSLSATFEQAAILEVEGTSKEDVEEKFRALFREQFQSWRNKVKITSKADLERFRSEFIGGSD